MRSVFSGPVKSILARFGCIVVSKECIVVSKDKYGLDVFFDIERLSKRWRRPINVIFDVGANDGAKIKIAQQRFPAGRIVAFEPHPKTFSRLQENMKTAENVELVNFALGSEQGAKTMFEYDQSDINSLVPDAPYAVRFNKKCTQIPVQCTTIDQFCSTHEVDQIDILKIDTEGFDLDVLRGASAMLMQGSIQFIYFEFYDINIRNGASGGALAPIDNFLIPYGYRFIASYCDYVVADGEFFSVSNALYALAPTAGSEKS
ncbi:FkbM family methyltransferase [Rhodoplanes sp. Z2-YC6860]|uniref:FkbM family methyltransferase n=1 Tax=Rhodoplanes sp. Z2-YC6860 TaxID=674703 RepID=UPI0018DC9ED8|nr:FkbM family methyltransferase [Rhodoplanes sp. Z2-YC6860]